MLKPDSLISLHTIILIDAKRNRLSGQDRDTSRAFPINGDALLKRRTCSDREQALAVDQIVCMSDLVAIGFSIVHHAGQKPPLIGEFRRRLKAMRMPVSGLVQPE